MTYDEALQTITAFCGGEPPSLWDELPLTGKPILYLPFDDPSDPPDDRQSSGLCILLDVEGDPVLVLVGLATASVVVKAIDRQMQITLSEDMGVEPIDQDPHPSLF